MRRSRPILSLRPTLIIGAGLFPLACALLWLALILLIVPRGGTVQIARGALLLYALLGLLAGLAPALALLYVLRAERGNGPQIEVLAAGLEAGDRALIERLFPNSVEVRLTPLAGGFSGATVLRAESWGGGATLQRSSVVKVGATAKLQPEVENWERYVREYVGNTATLLHVERRGGRMALRWAYAAFIGEQVQTLAEYAARGATLVPVIEDLFSSRSTLGLLLGTPRRDPHYALYREYSWTPRDWQRIYAATRADALGTNPGALFADLPDPISTIERWCDPQTGTGERADLTFDVPVTTIHGDLNSRNVLIDDRGSIFVIDFAHAGPGHLLRDFARLETELMLVLDQPVDEAGIVARVQQAARFLRTAQDIPALTLRDLLAPPPTLDQRGAAIVALRRQAHNLAGPWLSTSATSYLLALLHATLDTVRYAQCSLETRRAALLIAAQLCRQLA